jgi:hypothetical protein
MLSRPISEARKPREDRPSLIECKNFIINNRKIFVEKRKPKMWKNADVNAELRRRLIEEDPEQCSHSTKKIIQGCLFCFSKSFASIPFSDWCHNSNEIGPEFIFKGSAKILTFNCEDCFHLFENNPHHVSRGVGCGFCKSRNGGKLCFDLQCRFCFERTIASIPEIKFWDWNTNGEENPRFIFKNSHTERYFICPDCHHSFDMRPYHVVNEKFCPYCGSKKLCDDLECKYCYEKTMISVSRSAFWHPTKNKLLPRWVFKNSAVLCWFICPDCKHTISIVASNVTKGHWCKYCIGWVCGEEGCKFCEKICQVCLVRKARKKTRTKKLDLCNICFERCIKEDPNEVPLQNRAKITLEICTLAELQRQSLESEDSFLFYEPTAWDCPILPGSDRRPDNIWCFDRQGIVFVTSGACKINSGDMSYVLILEILEHSIEIHSKTRRTPDEEREKEIRNIFAQIPVGFVYVTMAHVGHTSAHKNDVFFVKGYNGEYEVLKNKERAFQLRIKSVKDKLVDMYINKSNESYWIGN